MNVFKGLTIFAVMTAGTIAFGADEIIERQKLLNALNSFVIILIAFVGLAVLAASINKMKKAAENPNANITTGSIVTGLIAGALLFNITGAASMIIQTVGSDGEGGGYCFLTDEDSSSVTNIYKENCWNSENSEITDDMINKIDKMNGNGDLFEKNIDIIMSIFQFIGLIYFAKGIYGLKTASEGKGDGYGKPILTMILAALVIDLPHTLEMLQETLLLIGFTT